MGTASRLSQVTRLVRRVLAYEWGMWRSLFAWALRRVPVDGRGAEAFPYASAVTPVIWTFIAISAVEVPLVHLLLPWAGLRTALLVVGVYGLLWMVGLLAALKVHPHLVDASGLLVRYGPTVAVLVPWEEIATVGSRRRSTEGMRSIQVLDEGEVRALSVGIANQTTVDVVLRRPMALLAARGDDRPVTAVRLHADDHAGLVRRLRSGLAARPFGGQPTAR